MRWLELASLKRWSVLPAKVAFVTSLVLTTTGSIGAYPTQAPSSDFERHEPSETTCRQASASRAAQVLLVDQAAQAQLWLAEGI